MKKASTLEKLKHIVKKTKNEKGSITLVVLAAMFFMLLVIGVSFAGISNKTSNQAKQIEKIMEEYADSSKDELDQKYDEAVKNDNENDYTVRYDYATNGGTSASKTTATVKVG